MEFFNGRYVEGIVRSYKFLKMQRLVERTLLQKCRMNVGFHLGCVAIPKELTLSRAA
jgi:hypothetical protein